MGNYYSGMMNATGGSELRHHGILGQKWGVRRFQNKDGTLTNAGRERYGYSKNASKTRFMSNEEYSRRVDPIVNKAYDYIDKYIDKTGKTHLYDDPDSILQTKRGKAIKDTIDNFNDRAEERYGVLDAHNKLYKAEINPINQLSPVRTKSYKNAVANWEDAGRRATADFAEESMKYINSLPKEDQYLGYFALATKMGFFY